MGASNTPLYDLIELSQIGANATFTTAVGGDGDILGVVDNATYTDREIGNSSTQITELNETFDPDNGVVTIDGVEYNLQLVTPTYTSQPVTVTYDGGASSVDLIGNHGTSEVAFLILSPVGGGADRYFMAVDDGIGDLDDIVSIQTRDLDWNPAGDDVYINLDQNNLLLVCFASGTLIETERGLRPVEQIKAGERVMTLDHGFRPLLWAHAQTADPVDGKIPEKQRPVRIRRGALGTGLPERDLLVSPQHRILINSKIAARMFSTPEILVPAVKLVGMPGIDFDDTATRVVYHHLFMGAHEILLANRAPAESFLPEQQALRSLDRTARKEIRALAPGYVAPARPIVERGPALHELLHRHKKNAKALCSADALKAAKGHVGKTPSMRLVAG